jgi:hypothetical protein
MLRIIVIHGDIKNDSTLARMALSITITWLNGSFMKCHHDTQHNDTQHNDIQHNDPQHNGLIYYQHN